MGYGIDISHWQYNIDFQKVFKQVEFVIMKCSQMTSKDVNFDKYYSSAKAISNNLGAYIYNKATTVEKAEKEANFAVTVLKGKQLPYGVWLDMEDTCYSGISKSRLTEIINTEANILRKAGFNVGIYCNLSWYNSKLDSALLAKSYPFWIARYPKEDSGVVVESLSVKGKLGVVMWQYSSKGNVNGISTKCDMDMSYTTITSCFKQHTVPAVAKPTLKRGSKGSEDLKLQKDLNYLGWNLVEDSSFGGNTEKALKEWQKKNGLKDDGSYGPASYKKMSELLS